MHATAVSVRERNRVIKAPKAASAAECQTLEQLPNVGPALAADLRLIGIHEPQQLRGRDAFVLYQQLCAATGQRHARLDAALSNDEGATRGVALPHHAAPRHERHGLRHRQQLRGVGLVQAAANTGGTECLQPGVGMVIN